MAVIRGRIGKLSQAKLACLSSDGAHSARVPLSCHSHACTPCCVHLPSGKEGGEASAGGTAQEGASDGVEAGVEAGGAGGAEDDGDTHSLQNFIVNDDTKIYKAVSAGRAGRGAQGPPR
jgi:hypothetical protein